MSDVHYDPMTGRRIEAPTPTSTKPARTLPPVKEPTKEDRINNLIAGYAFGLENNMPRTPAELIELRFLLGKELKPVPLTPDERKALVAAVTSKVAKDAFFMEKGDPVPVHVTLVPVPASVVAVHPELVGCSYAIVDDKIMLVGPDRKISALV